MNITAKSQSFLQPDEYYQRAFSRHRGLISAAEQERLRAARVAIPGMGGMGGTLAATLARAGIGSFAIADFDHFDIHNTNRQHGAASSTIGRNKARVMREIILDINPGAEVRLMETAVDKGNIDSLLDGADLALDALDVFAQKARRLFFARCRLKGIPVFSAAPLGFSAATFHFHPEGMSYDAFTGLRDGMSEKEMVLHFLGAIGAQGPHLKYMDTSGVGAEEGAAPSLGLACSMGAAMVAADVIAYLLGRREPDWVPRFAQFDPYARSYRRRWRPGGAKNPVQKLRMAILRRMMPALSEG